MKRASGSALLLVLLKLNFTTEFVPPKVRLPPNVSVPLVFG